MKAYLDIETDRQGNVCVIGIFSQPGGFVQFYGNDVTATTLKMPSRAQRPSSPSTVTASTCPRWTSISIWTSKAIVSPWTF